MLCLCCEERRKAHSRSRSLPFSRHFSVSSMPECATPPVRSHTLKPGPPDKDLGQNQVRHMLMGPAAGAAPPDPCTQQKEKIISLHIL
eukprot:365678-Chlamydomonas_euryale.AAC.4